MKEVWDDHEVGRAEAWHQVKGSPKFYRLLTSGPWKDWPDTQLLRDYNSCIVIVWVMWINLSVEVVGRDCLLDTSLKSENQTTCRKVKANYPSGKNHSISYQGHAARESFFVQDLFLSFVPHIPNNYRPGPEEREYSSQGRTTYANI